MEKNLKERKQSKQLSRIKLFIILALLLSEWVNLGWFDRWKHTS
jgi:hypothetical protein